MIFSVKAITIFVDCHLIACNSYELSQKYILKEEFLTNSAFKCLSKFEIKILDKIVKIYASPIRAIKKSSLTTTTTREFALSAEKSFAALHNC